MQNQIIVLAGPSGVGKSTIQNFLIDSCEVFIPVCVTTRKKRNDEDCDYIFTDEDTWKEYEKQGKY